AGGGLRVEGREVEGSLYGESVGDETAAGGESEKPATRRGRRKRRRRRRGYRREVGLGPRDIRAVVDDVIEPLRVSEAVRDDSPRDVVAVAGAESEAESRRRGRAARKEDRHRPEEDRVALRRRRLRRLGEEERP